MTAKQIDHFPNIPGRAFLSGLREQQIMPNKSVVYFNGRYYLHLPKLFAILTSSKGCFEVVSVSAEMQEAPGEVSFSNVNLSFLHCLSLW